MSRNNYKKIDHFSENGFSVDGNKLYYLNKKVSDHPKMLYSSKELAIFLFEIKKPNKNKNFVIFLNSEEQMFLKCDKFEYYLNKYLNYRHLFMTIFYHGHKNIFYLCSQNGKTDLFTKIA